MTLLVLMSVHNGLSRKTERTFPRVVASRRQFFKYTELTVTCEGFFGGVTKWRVLRENMAEKRVSCNKNSGIYGACHIAALYPGDSGEYWCESEDKRRSESVRITVTDADVILESPVRPVMVGDNVTLRCLEKNNKTASTKFDFNKDGVVLKTSSSGELTLHNISVSDQGLYKCKTSTSEFSEDNRLQVRAVFLECPDQPVMEGENVNLFCGDKMASSNYTSIFYKDDKMIGKSSTGSLTLNKVSKSDEGVYKCKASEDRESEEQWLAVGAADVILESPVRPVMVGDNVTLRCLEKNNKMASTKFDFNKDGVVLKTSSSGELTLHNISVSDQGLYKCKTSTSEFSEDNQLQVRAVFLECPDQPVMEGENVNLFCGDKMASSNYTSIFYKDDKMIGKSPTGNLTLNKVSKSDEGVYKCKASEDRESEEQWLAVGGSSSITSAGDISGISLSKHIYLAALVALPLLLLVLVFICKKHKGKRNRGPGSGHQAEESEQNGRDIYSLIHDESVHYANDVAVTEVAMYSTVNKAKKTKRSGSRAADQGELYCTADKMKKKQNVSSETALYSTVEKNKELE
ncbi:Fc receptor-like protein 5 [Eucyclogobius newberryi]|uniref:Fc receptor-like protein 5 n=1 Tax=Eucyclogobius newberryi TaxID=166745 RepID=UPI003B598571